MFGITISVVCVILLFKLVKVALERDELKNKIECLNVYYCEDNGVIEAFLVQDADALKYNLENKKIYFTLDEVKNKRED